MCLRTLMERQHIKLIIYSTEQLKEKLNLASDMLGRKLTLNSLKVEKIYESFYLFCTKKQNKNNH